MARSAQSGATVIVRRRKKIEYAPVEELRNPCRGREGEQANLTEGKNQSCPYTALFLPSQQATVTAGEIAVAEARYQSLARISVVWAWGLPSTRGSTTAFVYDATIRVGGAW
jgi:hypothetical protein